MEPQVHLVTAQDFDTFQEMLDRGKVFCGPIVPTKNTNRSQRWKSTVDMVADLCRVKEGDIIFVQVIGGNIYGAFRATTSFMENPDIPDCYRASTLSYYPEGGWYHTDGEKFPDGDYYWSCAIENFPELYFEKGISHRDLFDLKFRGVVWTIPERFKYNDKAKTVKPLDIAELSSILKLFQRDNRGMTSNRIIEPCDLENWDFVFPSLSTWYDMLENEKQLEGAIIKLLRDGHPETQQIFGELSFVANAIPSFYLDFMDIYGYQRRNENIFRHVVIELKKDGYEGQIGFSGCPVNQVLRYRDWIVQNRAKGDVRAVDSFVVAKFFDQEYIDSTEILNNAFGYKVARLVEYEVENNTLTLEEVTT
ncbi:MAG: hypothetical protein K9M96_05770 [Deltaproteobacteria bacterium]|nr:hypothetical protein [Deltaproteobacteria bacterium]